MTYTFGAKCDETPEVWELPICNSIGVTYGLCTIIEIECVIYGAS